jgi:hypothetical protein
LIYVKIRQILSPYALDTLRKGPASESVIGYTGSDLFVLVSFIQPINNTALNTEDSLSKPIQVRFNLQN